LPTVSGNPPTIKEQLSFVANEKLFKLALLLVKTGFSNGILEFPLRTVKWYNCTGIKGRTKISFERTKRIC
jgi:hypothetical protein